MHRDDQMTPNERMRAYFSGEEVDRLPIMPMAGTISAKMAGMTQRERRNSAKNDARAQIHAMMLGGPEEIEREIRKDFRKAWDSPRGFILATGCDTPLNAPVENLYAFMDIARRYARYPVDPARFEEPEGCEIDV